MEKIESRTVFLDIEAAGKTPGSVIIEIGAVAAVSGTYQELDSIDLKIEFEVKKADVRLLGVNKFSPTVWEKYALPEKAAAEKLAWFLRENATEVRISKKTQEPYFLARVAAHHAEFDCSRLSAWYKRLGLFFPAVRSGLCTEQAARWFFENHPDWITPRNYQLGTLAEYFAIPLPDHTALHDARTSLALARKLSELSRTIKAVA